MQVALTNCAAAINQTVIITIVMSGSVSQYINYHILTRVEEVLKLFLFERNYAGHAFI